MVDYLDMLLLNVIRRSWLCRIVVIDKVIRLYLHLPQHIFQVLIAHRDLLFNLILFSNLFIYDSLMFLLVIGTFISFVLSSLLLTSFVSSLRIVSSRWLRWSSAFGLLLL